MTMRQAYLRLLADGEPRRTQSLVCEVVLEELGPIGTPWMLERAWKRAEQVLSESFVLLTLEEEGVIEIDEQHRWRLVKGGP